jgi:hypothetical protein
MAVFAGCATIPTSSPPQAMGPVPRAAGGQDTLSVPAPAPGMSPETLIRDFLKASADPESRHGAARQFLTENAAHTWDDSPGATVIDSIDVLVDEQGERQPDRMSFQIRAVAVGHIEPDGVVGRDNTTVDRHVDLTRVHGEWRISGFDNGAWVDSQQFQYRYQRHNLYFLNPAGSILVSDPRWVAGDSATLADQLIRLLVNGPRPVLTSAVRTQFPTHAALRSPVARVEGKTGNPNGRGLRVDFSGVGDLDQKGRQLLAAQTIWTLASAGVAGPYLISMGGVPLDDRLAANGWTTGDVAMWDPGLGISGSALYAVYGGTLVRVTDRGVQRVTGALGIINSIRSAAVSGQEKQAAAVVDGADGSVELDVGPPDNTVNRGAVAEHTMTRPTWMPDESRVWTVLDGKTVVSVNATANGQLIRSDVDISQLGLTLDSGPITELRLSHDGVRAALVVGGRLITMNVRQNSDGGYSLTDAQSLLTSNARNPVDVTSVDWGAGDVLYVAQALGAPVLEVPLGSPFSTVISSRNLTPPISSISASATTIYVSDSRGVLQLPKGAGNGSEDYWKEIPMLHGTLSAVVLPK